MHSSLTPNLVTSPTDGSLLVMGSLPWDARIDEVQSCTARLSDGMRPLIGSRSCSLMRSAGNDSLLASDDWRDEDDWRVVGILMGVEP